jgi:hypothetical protein
MISVLKTARINTALLAIMFICNTINNAVAGDLLWTIIGALATISSANSFFNLSEEITKLEQVEIDKKINNT